MRMKELSNVAISNNKTAWKKKWKTKLKTTQRLYQSFVKSILLYSYGTWGLSRNDQKKPNSFHRQQLKRAISIKWSHRITSKILYQVTETEPLSIKIAEGRWKLLGHILRLPADCPAMKAIRYYFQERTNKIFVGRRTTTIITRIKEDITKTNENHVDFPITPLISLISLWNTHTKATNRKLWQKVISQVVDSAYSL